MSHIKHSFIQVYKHANNGYIKSKGQSRMDNPKKLATLVTQETGRRQTKQITQHRKVKRRGNPVVNPSACKERRKRR